MPNPINELTDTRTLGATGLSTSPITLGTSFLGAGTRPGDAGEAAAVELAKVMLHGPYALIDTSNNYAKGRSEAVLGLALADGGVGAGRTVVTKVDEDPNTHAFDRDRVRRSFEESCARLGVDRLELLHLHDPYSVTFEEAAAQGGAIEGMLQLKDEGLVGSIGIAAGTVSLMRKYVATGAFDVLLTHNRFTLVDRSAVPLIEDAVDRGMGVFNAAPFGGGLLSRGSASGATYAYTDASPELLAWVARVEKLCAQHGIDLPTAALHFSLRSPMIDSTIVGISSTKRIAQLECMRATEVPSSFWDELENLGTPPSTITD
ncbi:aldo/keto reductase [Arthrobacter sp. JZ12]|uniref:aldo/keto reductase n=1 Tax=Arthrobacter sp. JZ12 TaxID=2654190 RepID=UPI002B49C7C8|nr:aldo/keto reductase [Arthrobacter sp. JZ12]WRH23907.1 aldo/keto reductase [Arthrobacter sp. JZ12]